MDQPAPRSPAYLAGREAYLTLQRISANPFDAWTETDQHDDWQDGWVATKAAYCEAA